MSKTSIVFVLIISIFHIGCKQRKDGHPRNDISEVITDTHVSQATIQEKSMSGNVGC